MNGFRSYRNRPAAARRGVALLAILLGLLFVCMLTVLYMGGGGGVMGLAGGMTPFQRLEQTRNSVCEINRRTLTAELVLGDLSSSRRVDPQLQQRLTQRRTCPGEGTCYYADDEIYCTLHTPTPRFRDMLMSR